jgi:O-antigen/teichoic acid export membrane protein
MDSVIKQQDTINESLQKIAEGSSITFMGLILSLLPLLIIRLIIVRKWTESDYGVFSLAFSILTICCTISTLGLQQGLIRNIAYARGREEYEKIPVYISASIWFSLMASTIIGLLLFLFSENISKNIFHDSTLMTPLQILAFIIPFATLINVIVIVYRGFDQVKPTVYFQQILSNTLFPAFLIIMIIFNQSFTNVFYALAISTVITFVLLVYYSIKKIQTLEIFSIQSLKSPFSKELILFSFPLFITSIFAIILGWADTILLGILRNTTDVGLYNAALPLAQIVSFPLIAILLIYLPIFSGLFAKNKSEEIKRSYSILTKWLCYITLPFFFLLVLYPEPIITLLFDRVTHPHHLR